MKITKKKKSNLKKGVWSLSKFFHFEKLYCKKTTSKLAYKTPFTTTKGLTTETNEISPVKNACDSR